MRLLFCVCCGGLLWVAGLSGCQPETARQPPVPPRKPLPTIGALVALGQLTPRERAEAEVRTHQDFAQGIERGDIPAFKPEDSLTVYINKRRCLFANVHEFRRNIRHRQDSLTAAGATFDLDTTVHPFQQQGRKQWMKQ